jgi:membrane protein implicated in regulation of membrane protease activity
MRRSARAYLEELPLNWRVPPAGWTFVVAAPAIAVWASANGAWDSGGAALLALLWLLYLALLRWHYRAKGRDRRRTREGSRAR